MTTPRRTFSKTSLTTLALSAARVPKSRRRSSTALPPTTWTIWGHPSLQPSSRRSIQCNRLSRIRTKPSATLAKILPPRLTISKQKSRKRLTILLPILRCRRLKRQSASPVNRGRYISPCSSRCSPLSSSELPSSGRSLVSNRPASPTSSITTY